MLELIVKEYLEKNLDVKVEMEMPSNPPERIILVERTGGGGSDFVYNAMITVRSYAESKYEAAVLNEKVKKLMLGDGRSYDEGIATEDKISHCELNSDYDATDTKNKRYSYQAVFDLTHLL